MRQPARPSGVGGTMQGSQHSAVRDCLLAHWIIGSQIAFGEEGQVQSDAATIPNYVELTSDVVSAYVSNNSVSRTDLPGLIGTVHAALSGTSAPAQSNEKLTPPVPINKTIRPDYIISLEDGRRYKSMKRHLTGRFLVLLSVSLAAVIGLRLALLRTGRHIQKHVGFSDTALTDIAVTLPLISFMIVFVAGLVWLWW